MKDNAKLAIFASLNPYSTGSNSNIVVTFLRWWIWGLNPYSTGSNSNPAVAPLFEIAEPVLILILLEVTQMFVPWCRRRLRIRLNPYSTGSNSNFSPGHGKQPANTVLILILLEVTQMVSGVAMPTRMKSVLILILLEVTQI